MPWALESWRVRVGSSLYQNIWWRCCPNRQPRRLIQTELVRVHQNRPGSSSGQTCRPETNRPARWWSILSRSLIPRWVCDWTVDGPGREYYPIWVPKWVFRSKLWEHDGDFWRSNQCRYSEDVPLRRCFLSWQGHWISLRAWLVDRTSQRFDCKSVGSLERLSWHDLPSRSPVRAAWWGECCCESMKWRFEWLGHPECLERMMSLLLLVFLLQELQLQRYHKKGAMRLRQTLVLRRVVLMAKELAEIWQQGMVVEVWTFLQCPVLDSLWPEHSKKQPPVVADHHHYKQSRRGNRQRDDQKSHKHKSARRKGEKNVSATGKKSCVPKLSHHHRLPNASAAAAGRQKSDEALLWLLLCNAASGQDRKPESECGDIFGHVCQMECTVPYDRHGMFLLCSSSIFLFSLHFSCQVAMSPLIDVHSFCFTAAMHTDLQISAAGSKKNPF